MENKIEFSQCRERWGSQSAYRRTLYITLVPSDTSTIEAAETSLVSASDMLRKIIETWSANRNFDRMPWWPYNCIYCERTRKREEERGIEKWKRRGLCFRHYVLHHFVELPFIQHGGVNGCSGLLIASSDMIMIEDGTGKYYYTVYVYRDRAEIKATTPSGNYTFVYKDHKNAPNHLTSYEYLLRNVLFRLYLVSVNLKEMSVWRDYVLVINDVLRLPPKYENEDQRENEIYAKKFIDEFEYMRRVGRHIFSGDSQ
jgi:hypothetical protein